MLKGTGIIDENINWLGDSRFALWCIILILFTTSVGQPIVLYVSALGNVDATLVEAAKVDGATDLQVFWKIKWPQMMPTTLYILVITTINSFQCFALIQLLTSGGSGTNTVMYYIYYTAFKLTEQSGHFGYANAMGVILAIFIGLLSAPSVQAGKRKVRGRKQYEIGCETHYSLQGDFHHHPADRAGDAVPVPAVLDRHRRHSSRRTDIYASQPVWCPVEWVTSNFDKLFTKRSAPLFEIGALVGPTVPAAIRWLFNTVFMSVAGHAADLHHRRYGRLCAGQEALCGPGAAVHPRSCAPWRCPSRSF